MKNNKYLILKTSRNLIKTSFLFAIVINCFLLTGCKQKEGPLSISVVKRNQHPHLGDHDRVLEAYAGDSRIDSQKIYPCAGGGAILHYVEGKEHLTVVDENGMWYKVTHKGIKKVGWEWYTPLPIGNVKRIVLNKKDKYVIENVDKVDMGKIYLYKDPPD
jgi:hypothetical protein